MLNNTKFLNKDYRKIDMSEEESASEEILQLGGNIELAGFKELDRDSMVVLKKIVGNYAKKFAKSVLKNKGQNGYW